MQQRAVWEVCPLLLPSSASKSCYNGYITSGVSEGEGEQEGGGGGTRGRGGEFGREWARRGREWVRRGKGPRQSRLARPHSAPREGVCDVAIE